MDENWGTLSILLIAAGPGNEHTTLTLSILLIAAGPGKGHITLTLSILLIAAGPGNEHIAIACRITAMRLMSNYFHRLLSLDAHIDSRTDSQALRAEYCIVFIQHNTAI